MKKDMLADSKIVISGGLGYIGSNLVRRLLNYKVKHIYILDKIGSLNNLPFRDNPSISIIEFNIGYDDINSIKDIILSCDYLFHLAAIKSNLELKEKAQKVVTRSIKQMLTTNINGTYDLINLACNGKVKKIIYTSTLLVYGRNSLPPVKENELCLPLTIYGSSKLAGENIIMTLAKRSKKKFMILRLNFVYGTQQNSGYITKNFDRLIDGLRPLIFGDGNQAMDYIYISDVIDALINSTISPIYNEILNVGSGAPISLNTLISKMQKVSEIKIKPSYLARDHTHGLIRVSDCTKIKELLNWSPSIDIDQGLKLVFEERQNIRKLQI